MSWAWIVLICVFAAQIVSAAEISGRVLDAQTGEPIARAHVTIQFSLNGQAAELAVLTDVSGVFVVNNLPEGNWQIKSEKPGYLASSVVIFGEAKSSPVLRLARQAVVEGTVVDERGVGVPFASVQLVHRPVVNGRRQIQGAGGARADERGAFRIFGIAAGRYYVAVTAQLQRRSSKRQLAYAPAFYPDAASIDGAQPIELRPGTEEHLTIRLRSVPAYRVFGQVTPAGSYPNIGLHPQDRERFPVALYLNYSWDAETNSFTISGVTPGVYRLEATADLDGRQRRAARTITVGDQDVEGTRLEPGSLPEVTGRITVDGKPAPRSASMQISLVSPRNAAVAEMQSDGTFRIGDVVPDSYDVVLAGSGSGFVRSIRQGGRDVRQGGIVVGELPAEPVEIDLGLHGGTIEGVVALAESAGATPLVAGLFRIDDKEVVFDRKAYVDDVRGGSTHGLRRFTIQGVAPGEYVLLAWRSDAEIEYAETEKMRQYRSRGKVVRVAEDSTVSVVLDSLLTITSR